MAPPRIGLTLGDPSGIGPEVLCSAVAGLSDAVRERLVVFGDRGVVDRAGGRDLDVIECSSLGPDEARPGVPSLAGAVAQVAYLEAAVSAARSGTIAGLVTAPISKTQAVRAGFEFAGHTEFLAARLGAPEVAMMFAGPRLRVVLATVHQSLMSVGASLTVGLLERRIRMTLAALEGDFGISSPRLGVVGLNPHAGEGGMFGDEERRIIAPAIAAIGNPNVFGPLVPDAAFRDAAEGGYDGLIAMYHDQALIPVKLVDFEAAVNVTLGLPIVRTSPDHGTAYDIAGTGKARAGSFRAALDLALDLVDRRPRSSS
jgi:4-hydroxythreonine-4-phosphate dehydrogenase